VKLGSVRVDRYGPLSGIEHEFDGGLEVVYGPNESGKTLLLDALLRLCSPDAVDVLPDVGRVEEPPVGHAVLETGTVGDAGAHPDEPTAASAGTERHVLGDGTALDDVTDCTPRQLRNVFVVRDADLRLGDEHAFYDATARRLADLYTREIDAVREQLVDAGRLTPTTLNLARAEGKDDAREVHELAADLASRIEEYVAECREAGVEAAERERVEVATELERARRSLERQRVAETLATHERLSGQLDTVRTATTRLDDRDCTEAGLDALEDAEDELARIADRLDEADDRRDELRAERRRLTDRREELEAEHAQLERRLDDIAPVEERLDRYRDAAELAAGGTSLRPAAAVAVAAAIGAGAAAVAGVPSVALGLTALAAVAGAWTLYQHRSVRLAGDERQTVLTSARDAGLDVETIGDVAPAIHDLRDERDRPGERIEAIEQELALAERRLEDVVEEREAAIERRRELRRERRERLRDAGVPDVEAYRDAVEAAAALEDERRAAAASLAERLGDPGSTAPMEERIEHWDAKLEELRADASAHDRDDATDPATDVAADAYDPDELDRLEDEVARLEDRLGDLDDRLADHEAAIDRFADELARLPTARFRDEPIGLAARSVDGLAATARDLETLVGEIERDADVSRAAIAALEDVRADEEAKLAELFGPESIASETFASITDGRYEQVAYDPSGETLVVEAADGSRLTPRELSRGATDQLYLAARIGLADRLLAGEPGFLLLDDPLLPADPERLAAGFDALRRLAEDGWQVVYWTAKPEVGEELVSRHGVPCRQFDRLE
jgi:exonuclease SbcC